MLRIYRSALCKNLKFILYYVFLRITRVRPRHTNPIHTCLYKLMHLKDCGLSGIESCRSWSLEVKVKLQELILLAVSLPVKNPLSIIGGVCRYNYIKINSKARDRPRAMLYRRDRNQRAENILGGPSVRPSVSDTCRCIKPMSAITFRTDGKGEAR